jgi:hypothetical protein
LTFFAVTDFFFAGAVSAALMRVTLAAALVGADFFVVVLFVLAAK